jgi:PAS domain S-box-containing protein
MLGVLVGVLVSTDAASQVASAPPILSDFSRDWRWVEFTAEDGLPAGTPLEVLMVSATPWTYTETGLAYYDGFRWKQPPLPGEFDSDSISFISREPNDQLLVVAAGRVFLGGREGLVEYPLPEHPTLETHRVERALTLPDGGLIATVLAPAGPARLIRVTSDSGNVSVLRELPFVGSAIWRSRTGRIWGNVDNMLQTLSGDSWTRHPATPAAPLGIRSFVEFQDGGGVYLPNRRSGLRVELARFSADGGVDISTPAGMNQLVSVAMDADGQTGVLVTETSTVLGYEGGEWRDANLTQRLGFDISMARFTVGGGERRIWFATPGKLHLYKPSVRRWGEIQYDFTDPRNRVNALLLHSRTGELWQATTGGVSLHESANTGRWFSEIAGRDVSVATGLVEGADGSIWLSSGTTFEGALRYTDEWEYLGAGEGLDAGRIHRIIAAPDSSIWFASLGGVESGNAGVYRWHPRTGFEAWSRDHGMPPTGAYDVLDRGSEVWIADREGLHRIRNGVNTSFAGTPVGPSGTSLGTFALAEAGGKVWFASHPGRVGGMGYVDEDDNIVIVELPGGAAGQRVWSLTVGPAGDLWAGTEAGVSRLHEGRWSLFGTDEGFDAGSVWPVVPTESIVILGTSGSGLRILSLRETADPPPIVTVTIPIVEDGTAHMVWRPSSWWGGVPSERIKTRSRVDGGRWSRWDEDRDVRLTRLRSGTHSLEIEAKGLFGQVADKPTLVTFLVRPPLFLTPLFAVPMGLLTLALLLVLGYTARRRAEQATLLAGSEQRLRKLVESAPEAIGLLNAHTGRFVDANTNAERLFGISAAELREIDPFAMSFEENKESRRKEIISRTLSGETICMNWHVRSAAGERIPCELQLSRLSQEDLIRMSLIDKREKETADAKRQELEAQLRQSQKLEAMGQLTGGIAHDFNNLLTVIRGNLDLLKSGGEPLGKDDELLVETAIHAADRSADLTSRLLAFSRKQPLSPRTVSVPDLLHGLSDLLRRTLGETLYFVLNLDPDLGHILVDPNGLENAIINLAINSRDAMRSGGELTIAARSVVLDEGAAAIMEGIEPGPYVSISVADTGSGMSPETGERAFDPFFTTKGVGKGSGLGLSMVYGFVRQSGGAARLHSELGQGTTVELLLPLSPDQSSEAVHRPVGEKTPSGKGERILVVEDDHAVRTLIVAVLSRLGYEVHSVEDAHAAIEHLETEVEVDLLLSDIVLPGGMHGIDLGRKARAMRPGLRVLHVSGYAEEGMLRLVEDDPYFDLLEKPFEPNELARRVRDALDRRGPTSDRA